MHQDHHRRTPMLSAVLALSIVAASCAGGTAGPPSRRIVGDQSLAQRIDHVAETAFRELPLAGMSIAVQRDGEIVFASGYGMADLEAGIPAGIDTVYRMGSIGKSFTAAAMLRLAAEDVLSIDDPVAAHVDGHPDHVGAVTLRDLLAHTSGLAEDVVAPLLEATGGVGLTRAKLIDLVVSQPLRFEPGTDWSYSNTGYLLAGEVIEGATKIAYADHIERAILEPFGLTSVTYCPDERPDDPLWAAGYELPQDRWARAVRLGRAPGLTRAAPINMDIAYAAGALCSSVVDLVRWPELLSTEVLTPAQFDEMVRPTEVIGHREVGYGLGIQLRTFGDHEAFAHGGVINGFVSMVARFHGDDTTVALLVNTLLPESSTEELLARLLSAVFDEPESAWADPYQHERVTGPPPSRRS